MSGPSEILQTGVSDRVRADLTRSVPSREVRERLEDILEAVERINRHSAAMNGTPMTAMPAWPTSTGMPSTIS